MDLSLKLAQYLCDPIHFEAVYFTAWISIFISHNTCVTQLISRLLSESVTAADEKVVFWSHLSLGDLHDLYSEEDDETDKHHGLH